MSEIVSFNEAKTLIQKWANLFDAHASPETIYRYTAGEDFAIQFQDLVYRGLAGLREHDQLKSVFFEERHLYYNFQIVDSGPPLTLETQMVWEAYKALPDKPSGEHLIADLRHRWKFSRKTSDGEPVFLHHELLELNYREGFAPLTSDPSRLHTDGSRVGMK
ncbi:hypothetical protein [Rubellicoccus peritrichatus]|uniref:Uncharacterized protein n=1 Tax=Rubellicoccus peritrichatus TaxID=3080537 RepID=A0AAQ3LDH9_9BACT|nr:hypothetical protein [Puniceicoccus sp. CR14]WOO43377.1 hypothetical protein RZN69_09780 [Puniceicoccus sp. CR14]